MHDPQLLLPTTTFRRGLNFVAGDAIDTVRGGRGGPQRLKLKVTVEQLELNKVGMDFRLESSLRSTSMIHQVPLPVWSLDFVEGVLRA